MAYDNNQQRRIQSPEESLHWISFNLKKLTEAVNRVADLLSNSAPTYSPPPASVRSVPQPQPYYAPQKPSYPAQEEIPF